MGLTGDIRRDRVYGMTRDGETIHNLRMDDDRWQRLTVLAAKLVHDSELPVGTAPHRARVGTLLRLVADGVLVVSRPGSTET